MQIELDLVSFATTSAALYALVEDRVSFNLIASGDPLPAVTIQQVMDEPVRHMGGRAGLSQYVYQFNCWGTTRGEASDVRKAIIETFDEYRGPLGGWNVQGIFVDNARDNPAGPPPGSDGPVIAGVSIDVAVWANEQLASVA